MFKNKHIQIKLAADTPEETVEPTPIDIPVEAILEIFDHVILGIGALIVLKSVSTIIVNKLS